MARGSVALDQIQATSGTYTSGNLVVFDTGGVPVDSGAPVTSGTVTSVALTVPSRQSVIGSPVTSSGTLAVTDNVQNANKVFAGPATGVDAAPTFRAMVAADVPNIAESQVISLTADLAAKAPLASPTLTGTPTAPTPSTSDNSTKIATTAYVQGQAGLGTGLAGRTTAAVTTASLVNLATETGGEAMAKSLVVVKIVSSCKARVQLYSTAAQRDADVGRAAGIDPTAGTQHGLIADLYLSDGAQLSWLLSPSAEGSNGDVSPSTAIYYRITNLDITQAVTVTFTYVALEV